MSRLGYARLLLNVEDVKSGALIFVLYRKGNLTRFLHRKSMRVYTATLGEKSLLWFPPAQDILMMLSELTPVGVMSQRVEGIWTYSIVNMQFGIRVDEVVPVFEKGKKKGKRTVSYTRHVRIRAKTFEQAAYFLFFATLGGKLCRKLLNGKFEYLYWDSLDQRFKTEIRKDVHV